MQAPKTAYIRDKRLRAMCEALPCQVCGAHGTTWAHSNQAKHGKGRSIKASDVYVAALCGACHHEIDQGRTMSRAERVQTWDAAHAATVAEAQRLGLWPAGVPVPDGQDAEAEAHA